MNELHLECRPKRLEDVIGQPDAVATLRGMEKGGVKHTMLFTGPSGCGKTTLARIVAFSLLRCAKSDCEEINAANSRGIDMVRDIQARAGLAPMGGPCRVWIIDEAHQLTADAQGALLKLLEEPPKHVYFMLATTHPDKLREAIRTRCAVIRVAAVSADEIKTRLLAICVARSFKCPPDIVARIADVADGSVRKALVLLDSVKDVGDPKRQAAIVGEADAKQAAFEIARAIMGRKPWDVIAKIINDCQEEPEGIRWMILSYFSKVALGGGRQTAFAVDTMKCFQYNYFDTKRAGLIISCHEACALWGGVK